MPIQSRKWQKFLEGIGGTGNKLVHRASATGRVRGQEGQGLPTFSLNTRIKSAKIIHIDKPEQFFGDTELENAFEKNKHYISDTPRLYVDQFQNC